jgi:hypothetical protein
MRLKKVLNEGNQIHNLLLCVVRNFVIRFYYDFETVINYGSGSDFLTSYDSGSGSTRQKVIVRVHTGENLIVAPSVQSHLSRQLIYEYIKEFT